MQLWWPHPNKLRSASFFFFFSTSSSSTLDSFLWCDAMEANETPATLIRKHRTNRAPELSEDSMMARRCWGLHISFILFSCAVCSLFFVLCLLFCTSQRFVSALVFVCGHSTTWLWFGVDLVNCSDKKKKKNSLKMCSSPCPPSPCHLSIKQIDSNGIPWILGVWSCCFRTSWIWMMRPRQSGNFGWEIRGLDLSGCTLCKVCASQGETHITVHAHLHTHK